MFSVSSNIGCNKLLDLLPGSSRTENTIEKLGNHEFTLTSESGIELSCTIGAALLESKTLSVDVMESTLRCQTLDTQCITVEGNVFPAFCVFPFDYKGRHYKACTDSTIDTAK